MATRMQFKLLRSMKQRRHRHCHPDGERTRSTLRMAGVAVVLFLLTTINSIHSWFWFRFRFLDDDGDDDGSRTAMASTSVHCSVIAREAITATSSSSSTANSGRLLNHDLVRQTLLAEAPWAESHGADHRWYLGAAMLYYGLAYSFQCRTTVVLGSGGGFVPRVLRQAQRDLERAGIGINMDGVDDDRPYQLILIDAHRPESGYGSTFYAENRDTVMRRQFPDIRYVFETTDDAFVLLQKEKQTIDCLHIDADHSHEQSWRDFENYAQLLSARGVVTLHDTCRDPNRNCKTGVPQTVDRLRRGIAAGDYNLQLTDAHYLYRGIAWAVPGNAPALEPPANRRRNFCQTNAASLHKSSPGFTRNRRDGRLPTLGDYYHCAEKFPKHTTTSAAAPCPHGFFRRDEKGPCRDCVPGLRGPDCQRYQYERERQRAASSKHAEEELDDDDRSTMERNLQRLAALWLSEQRVRHLWEYGVSSSTLEPPVSQHWLLSDEKNNGISHLQSVVAIDPRIRRPVWSDNDDEQSRTRVRWLPVELRDALDGGTYRKLVSRSALVDAFVCWQCDERMFWKNKVEDTDNDDEDDDDGTTATLQTMLSKYFPRVTTVVLEGSADDALIEKMITELVTTQTATAAWKMEEDVQLSSSNKNNNNNNNKRRRMVMLSKQQTTTIQGKALQTAMNDNTSFPRKETKKQQRKIHRSKHHNQDEPQTPITPFSDFEVAGVNLASYHLGQNEETYSATTTMTTMEPFELFDDFDLTDQIMGNETWKDLVRYRRDVQRRSLCFYVDKVARKRWLPSVGLPSPKTHLLKYASELTKTGRLEDERKTILKQLQRMDNHSYAAKPTHLSCSGGVWLTKKTGPDNNSSTLISHGSKKFQAAANDFELPQIIADSLARDLHEGPRCGSQIESWALYHVRPGVMIEERFTAPEGDDDAGGMEFKVVTLWGRVWLAQWRPGVSKVRAFLFRNGTTVDWNQDSSEPLPDWVDWPRIVAMAEQLGAHKDMFRTDIFVGIPAESLPVVGATREERLSSVQYVVSETEIHPTPIKGTAEVFNEAGRLWLAGYKIGNYKVVPDSEVPQEFLDNGSLAVQAVSQNK